MEVLICGTAAAEGVPALFCSCRVCTIARERGGKELRTRSAYQLADWLRIDFGPDALLHDLRYGLRYENLRHLLMSHSHWDHWSPLEMMMRQRGFSAVPENTVLHIYGNHAVQAKLQTAIDGDFGRCFIEFHPVKLWEPISLGQGVTAIPLEAAHDRNEMCVNWLVEENGRSFLQGHDTGWWGDDTWRFLAAQRVHAVSMDSTNGSIDNIEGHLGAVNVVDVRDRLRESGALASGARFIATHFSHNGGWLHTELEEFYAVHGIEVAWDGYRFTV